MVQLVYKYDKCSECGQEQFQWGAVIEYTTTRLDAHQQWRIVTDHIFICHLCIKEMDIKLNDMIEEAKHKTALKITLKYKHTFGSFRK